MTREIVLIPAFIGGLMMVSTAQAPAQEFCAARTEMVKSLSDKYREAPAAVGQVSGEAVIEVFVSDKGTWTILATGTDGQSCVVSAGENWEINVAALGDGA
jgi:hypothetical protein